MNALMVRLIHTCCRLLASMDRFNKWKPEIFTGSNPVDRAIIRFYNGFIRRFSRFEFKC